MGEFGASTMTSNPSQQELENAIGLLDKKLLEMKVKHAIFNSLIASIADGYNMSDEQFSGWF